MSLQIFEKELRNECQKIKISLEDGSRIKRLNKKENSLISVIFINRFNPTKLYRSCIISFGYALEKATMNYAKQLGSKTYKNKKFLSVEHDIVFRIKKIVYNLESKANIELDVGKTKKALETLHRKHKIVFNGLDCQNEGWSVISKFVVWTKETSTEASLIAKRPLEEKHLMGFKDFFILFNIQVTKKDFFKMLQKVWIEEVERYFPK